MTPKASMSTLAGEPTDTIRIVWVPSDDHVFANATYWFVVVYEVSTTVPWSTPSIQTSAVPRVGPFDVTNDRLRAEVV